MKKMFQYGLFFILLFSTGLSVHAQKDKQAELEQKKQQLQEEIRQINNLLFSTKKKEKSVLSEVENIAKRIQVRENLIKVTNQQANLISREINTNISKIAQLRKDLEALKVDYGKLIEKSYKSKSDQSRIMFLLSSENFLQAYKRVQYMKQYATHRKKQGEAIQSKTQELQELNKSLVAQQKEKQKLVEENRIAKNNLSEEKIQQEKLVSSLKKEEGKYALQIKDKQKEAAAIDKQIEDLIRAAILEANKASGVVTSKTNTSSPTFAMTAEAKALAANFTSNKGKLPWPVEKGIVITNFGTTQHPTLPNVKTYSSGVEIATESGAKARAAFDGEVLAVTVIKGANKAIQIRHGDYITVYQNITDVYVKKGDKVKTKQEIGKIFTNPTTGKTTLKFLIFQNTNKLNPAEWVYRM
ncbi:MAG: peptidase M23 [Flavobacteriaceae bacterium CG2_30_34_30]|nr:MAG: peptidase M23 [Flavobacteriaceae bacterium CG2_30_34_30]PIQ18878.1 MAG: peptidase M23 [Flavobacteriaceae bacterium CG18_big_fil_WC_8_21_14_2_50_34_36]PIV49973.1 MAG: peptidase M23 [Flavobacteriaceae bacterium CG02_land_8_20_14_3_00_34_13]PIZ07337.1 MAG: peptidase M23 [Flavobacteriaceae bacterium CG_4_10_14_0_8_um_filter_34_31]